LTAIMDDIGANDSRFAALAMDFDISNDANVSARELVMDIAETTPLQDVAALPAISDLVRLPFRYLPQPAQKLCAAGIVDMLETEFQRVGADRCDDLIQKRLVGERVLHAPRRTDPRRAQWCA